jgi:hypothetical protein
MPGEKHRTEVTEATEGELGLVGLEVLLVNTEASARELRAGGKSIARRSRRPRRGNWDWLGWKFSW